MVKELSSSRFPFYNGAANIVAKSKQESQLDIPLEGLSRGVLDTPVKVRIS